MVAGYQRRDYESANILVVKTAQIIFIVSWRNGHEAESPGAGLFLKILGLNTISLYKIASPLFLKWLILYVFT